MKNIIQKVYRKINPEKPLRYYQIDGFTLDLGDKHNLSLTQKYHPMYDRFVPYLAQMTIDNEKGYIIDIGANVGDTTAAMLKHTDNRILCIEPTKEFFGLLQKNIEAFGSQYKNRIDTVNAYIALNDEEEYISRKIDGTAIKVKIDNNKAEARTYTLQNLLQEKSINIKQISLIKVDTDGYDSECIMSMGKELEKGNPVLYWENQIDTHEQFNKYIKLIEYLQEMKYKHIFIFDNFGNYLCRGDLKTLEDMNKYLLRILAGKSSRSFYYIDVLACKDGQEMLCEETIAKYLKTFEVDILGGGE